MIRFIIVILISSISFIASAQTKDEEVLLKNDSIELAGTLTHHNKTEPLLIYIAGSGNVDRNGNQLPYIKANYIAQFRKEITKTNIAFFSYDKRTANPKNRPYLKNTLFDDFVTDAKKVVQHFKKDKRFNSIILIGHSQGSLVSILLNKHVDKIISLAGPGDSCDKALVEQISTNNKILGETARQHCDELLKTDTIKKVNPFLHSLFKPENQKFLANWFTHNPSKEISKIKIPVAIIQGKKDIQVSIEDAKKLHQANPKSQLFVIETMNHVLKTIPTLDDKVTESSENKKSYTSAEYPISKELITIVTKFIKE